MHINEETKSLRQKLLECVVNRIMIGHRKAIRTMKGLHEKSVSNNVC